MSKLLDKAKELTEGGIKSQEYDHPLINFLRTCIRWNMSDIISSPYQMSFMLVDLKFARDVNKFKHDNQLDSVGYLNCLSLMQDKLIEMKYCKDIDDANVILSMSGLRHLAHLYETVKAYEERVEKERFDDVLESVNKRAIRERDIKRMGGVLYS